jgi:poly-gamma-glutamate capsule biosynthesis protein CapA/YwtB (metallophosphatase superfamily)
MVLRLAMCCALALWAAGSGRAESISIAAVGDIMLGTDYPDNRLPADDARGYLEEVAGVLQSADLAIGNLEGVLLAGGTPRKTCETAAACFLFRSPPRYGAHLRTAGFDVMSLANNHARDFGEAGRTATMAALDRVGIFHSGRRGDIASFMLRGLRVAFIAFSPTRESYLLNDIPTAVEHVAALAGTHDLVIVSFHGGAEGRDAMTLPFAEEFYFGETRGEVVRFARGVIDAGADLVIGHGPHVPRALELYRGRLVAYSLGNFATHTGVSVSGEAGWAALLTVTIDEQGRFLSGRVHSALQGRPASLRWDEKQQAARLVQRLTEETFGRDMLRFTGNGGFSPGAAQVR